MPVRHHAVDAHEVGEEMVLYHSETEVAVSLNVSARAIWELCDGTRSVAAICSTLERDIGHRVEGALRADVLATLRSLHELGAVYLGGIPSDRSR